MDPAIRIRNLNHWYGAGKLRKQVLFDVTVDVYPGEIVINTGPSGSGKTTMLTLACGLRSVQDGSVVTLGTELAGASQSTLVGVRRNIGFIFQAHNLVTALTARQNVEMSLHLDAGVTASESRARAAAMLGKVGLAEHVDAYPNQLSGGQKQRVAIARALARRPKIVLADEPTAALDKASGREVVDLLRDLAQEEACAILLVTHDVRILDVADRILTLEDGRLSSFAAGIAANTERAFAAFSRMQERGELRRHLGGLPDTEFVQVLGTVTAEFEAFLKTTDVAGSGATRALLHQVVEASALRIRDKLHAERATVYLVDRPRNLLRSSVAQTEGEGHLDIRLPIGVGIAGQVAATGDVLNVADPYRHPHFNPEVDRRTGFTTRALLSVPVTGRSGDVVGVLQLVNKQDGAAFSDEDARGLVDFAAELSVIIETCSRLATLSPGAGDTPA